MSQPLPYPDQPQLYPETGLSERFRGAFGQRARGVVLTLLLEGLLVVLLLSFGPRIAGPEKAPETTTVLNIDAPPAPQPVPAPPESKATDPAADAPAPPEPAPVEPQASAAAPAAPSQPSSMFRKPNLMQPEVQVTRPPAVIPLTPNQMAAADLSNLPAKAAAPAAARPTMGPVGSARSGDTARVGTAPNGEPLYAAAWYREPTDAELGGYLSTASGPGWGLIACRTVADFRVEDCVGLGESPQGSQIERAVLAAAWQFRVRPPRIGGQSQVGSWVRIRIDYGKG
ncbi:hypothetical protein [Novosphingopyxis sp.]|uniref:hypothetical protein n=1 Tax=Novosphingopyxis sp. TaxID=2709690 RepID=UPI003B5A23CB